VPISRDKAEALDPFDLNLYACKVDRAAQLQAQGMLARETLHDDLPLSSTWSGALFSLPALAALAPATWRDYDYSIAYGKAVLAWCGSRRSDLEPEARVRLLAQGLSHLQSAIEEDDNHPAVAVLGIRMCADAGMRSQALAIAASFLEQMSADEAFPLDRPVPPAYEAFDQIRPTRSMGSFLHQSVVEFNLDRSRHSTVFGGGRTTAFEEGLANPEHTARFERTAVLCKARDGTPLRVETSARLFFEAPDNRNFGFWRKAAEAGKLFSTSGNPTWDCQIHSPIPARMQPAGEDEALSRIAAHEARGDAHSTLAEAEKGLLAFPKSANLMNIAAAAAHSLKDSAKAERLWRAAISADPAYADPYSNLGFLLTEARRFEDAEVLLHRALEINPRHGGALCNLGILFIETGRSGDAERAFTNVLSILPTHPEALNNLGLLLKARGDVGGAEQAYLRALAASPQHARAFNNLGVLLFEAKQNSRAETMLRRALQLMPDYPDAHNNLGLVLMQARRIEEAESEFRRAIELKSDDPGVQMNLGVLMKEMRRFPEAEAAFRRALEISPDCGNAAGEAYFCSRYLCDWSRCADDEARLADMIDRGIGDISPFILLAIDNAQLGDIPQLQRRGAALYARDFCRSEIRGSTIVDHLPTARNRLRIGYLSADFHQHPTMYLLRGVLAAHDRSRYSVHLYSYGSVDDEMTARARAACEVFRDISQLSDDEAANAISADKIDILIDLKGFTFDARPEISARRPAPIIASWLGYPGTLGQSQLADYVIGDPIVTPPENAEHFVERIARLPYCYQPNDRERSIGLTPDRSQVGLPEHAFVFCCFNSSYKLTPDMFYLWCRLLHEVPGSVLWLLEPCSQAITNLRCSALQRGVDPERIVFAPVQPLAEHLARLQLADLALDTFPYTSHTTGSDVLWAGVPLVTRIGQTFASRVAASLLQSIGLPELVTHSPNDYVALALSLAKNPERLAEIRLKLERNRLTTPLFDTESFTVELEQLYARIWEEHGKE
jgi:predicted O-linked N-acetylglucosamine transferase (SPINDLY family)